MDNTGHAQEGLKHRRLKSEKDPLQRLGEIVSQRRWSVLIASLVAFVIFGIVGIHPRRADPAAGIQDRTPKRGFACHGKEWYR